MFQVSQFGPFRFSLCSTPRSACTIAGFVVLSLLLPGCESSQGKFREMSESDGTAQTLIDDSPQEIADRSEEPAKDSSTSKEIPPESVTVLESEPAAQPPASEATTPTDSTVATSDNSSEPAATSSMPVAPSEGIQDATESTIASDSSAEKQPGKPRTLEEEMAYMRAKLLGLSEEEGAGTVREIKLLIPEKQFDRDEKTGAVRITFDDIDLLKVLNMEPVPVDADKHLPDWLRELDGQKIVLRGWMFPTVKSEGIQRFLFVRDNGICCFGRLAKLYDKLGVTLKEGQTTRYIEGRPFDVVGTFVLDPWVLDDELDLLYHIENATVLDQ